MEKNIRTGFLPENKPPSLARLSTFPDSSLLAQSLQTQLTRREFLQLGWGILLGMVSLNTSIHTTALGLENIIKNLNGRLRVDLKHPNSQLSEAIDLFEVDYGLELYNGPPVISSDHFVGDKLTNPEIMAALQTLGPELWKYPRNYFSNNGISQLRLLKHLSTPTELDAGTYIAEFGAVFLDCQNRGKALAELFHHENYHGGDWKDRGFSKDDKVWKSMQPCSCQLYKEDSTGSTAPDDLFVGVFGELNDPNAYGKKNPTEDRATVAAALMMAETHQALIDFIANLQKTKPVDASELAWKYETTIGSFFKFSDGKMNAQYWVDLLAGRITENYFE